MAPPKGYLGLPIRKEEQTNSLSDSALSAPRQFLTVHLPGR